MSQFLIIGDVDHIQDYVFAAPRLRAIRGASALVDSALRSLPQDDARILRRHGGQAVALLDTTDDGNAKALCAKWEQHFRTQSAGATTITAAFVDLSKSISFKAGMAEAFAQVCRKKDSHQQPEDHGNWTVIPAEMLASNSYERRCEYCQAYPACPHPERGKLFWHPEDAAEEEPRYICLPCWRRVDAVEDIQFDKVVLDNVRAILQRQRRDLPRNVRLPYDLAELWRGGTEERDMAYVVADGNGFGQLQERIPDPNLYRTFARELEDLTFEALAQAADAAGLTNERRYVQRSNQTLLPFMPIILAGDDLVVLLPADCALPFVEALCQRFAEGSQSQKWSALRQVMQLRGKERLTLSAGVAIAKANFAISAYRRLAGELRREAKKALSGHPKAEQEAGMIDFAVITTATVQPLSELRSDYERQRDRVWLTARPFTVSDFADLCKLARALQALPRSKRKFLYTALFQSISEAIEAYRFVLSREHKENMHKIVEALKSLGCRDDNIRPFRNDAFLRAEVTPLVDALEVAELMERDQE